MSSQRLSALLVAASLTWASSAALPAADDSLPQVVVKGKVVKVHAEDRFGALPASVEVIHVYRGEPELKGTTFTDRSRGRATWNLAFYAWNDFVEGEEGIWVLSRTKKQTFPAASSALGLGPRIRKVDSSEWYAASVELAELVEKSDGLDAKARLALAEKSAYSANTLIGRWAVYTLLTAEGDARTKAVEGLKTDAKLPLATQTALDELLCERQAEDWVPSKSRWAMYRGWANAKADELQADSALRRWSEAQQGRQLNPAKGVELVILAAENNGWTTKSRARAIDWVRIYGNLLDDQEQPFEWLVSQVQKNKDVDLCRAAAASLSGLHKAPHRLRTLSALLATQTDKKVVEHLKAAIAQPK